MLDQEWLCQQLVAHTQDAILFADRDGIIRLWNAGAEGMFGYRAAEALGQSLDLIIPAHLRARHWEGYRRVMATGVTRYGRELLSVPAVRRDGTRIILEFSIVLLRQPTGELLGIGAIMRDVTEQRQREKALRARLTALEAQSRQQEEQGG